MITVYFAKYLPATEKHGARFKVYRAGDDKPATVPYDYGAESPGIAAIGAVFGVPAGQLEYVGVSPCGSTYARNH